MGQIIRTDAVVLRSIPFRETSQIVTLFTREKGKIATIAKGSRNIKSQFGATLQPMSYIQAIFYYKSTRELQTLSETSHIAVMNRITNDLDKIAVGMRIIEFVYTLMQQEEDNPPVFNLLVDTLQHLDGSVSHVANIWLYFQLRMAGCLGFQPDVQRDDVEALPEEGGALLLETGAIHAGPVERTGSATSPITFAASRTALRAFAILARAELSAVTRLSMKPEILIEVGNMVDAYMKFHFEDALPTRSDRVIGQMKR